MPKGFFTQGSMVLTKDVPSDETIAGALASFPVVRHTPASGEKNWMGGYPTWLIAMRPEVNGYVLVDVVDSPWPDHMGSKEEPMLFGAWSMAQFGPFAWPGNLQRAAQNGLRYGYRAEAEIARDHRAFVRIRSSYILGADPDAMVMPPDYAPKPELELITTIARALVDRLSADSACYFNPNGEVLLAAENLRQIADACAASDLVPLPLWTGARFSSLEAAPAWVVGDTLGMAQLDAPDHEACFPEGRHDLNDVRHFLLNLALYTLDESHVIKTGHTADGPGGPWRAMESEESLLPAMRPVIRWFQDDGPAPPKALMTAAEDPVPPPKRPALTDRLKRLFGRS